MPAETEDLGNNFCMPWKSNPTYAVPAILNGCKKSETTPNNAQYETLYRNSVYDSAAWEKFNELYDANLQYWERQNREVLL